MPNYIYYCKTCKNYIEQFEISPRDKKDDSEMRCLSCGSTPKRIFNAPPVIYLGKGFYSTDNKKKGN